MYMFNALIQQLYFKFCYFSRIIIPGNNVYNAYLFVCFVISVTSIKSVLWRTCFQRSRDVEVLRCKISELYIPDWRLLYPFPQSPQKLSFRSPLAVPVCHKEPGRSGKNWIF